MIVGVGIDLMESSRVAREIARGGWPSEDGVFTPGEIAYCGAGKRAAQRYGACFAGKEATLKALGAAVADSGTFREVEVKFESGTQYQIVLHNRLLAIAKHLGVRHINLSIAATRKCIGAMVIMESQTPDPDRTQV